jgi:hypothetical protein
MSFAAGAFSSGVRGGAGQRHRGDQNKATGQQAANNANEQPISTIATGSTNALNTYGVNQCGPGDLGDGGTGVGVGTAAGDGARGSTSVIAGLLAALLRAGGGRTSEQKTLEEEAQIEG